MKRFWLQLWSLLVLAGIGLLAMVIIMFLAGVGGLRESPVLYLNMVQWAQTLVVMMGAPLAWTWFHYVRGGVVADGSAWRETLANVRLLRVRPMHLLLAALVMVAMLPLADAIEVACTRLPLPEGVRQYCEEGFLQNQQVLAVVLQLDGVWGWAELFLLMCLGTAVGEELMFRGALLNCFVRAGGVRWHVAAWLVGLIFALIHFEPMGLIPRWLLGTLFAYMVWWSGSLWPGIVAHCINNLVALISYKMASADELMSLDRDFTFGPMLIACSAVVTALLIGQFYRSRVEKVDC